MSDTETQSFPAEYQTSTARCASTFPVRKVTAGALAGAFTALVMAIYSGLNPGHTLRPELVSLLTTIATALISYWVPPAHGEVLQPGGTGRSQPSGADADRDQ